MEALYALHAELGQLYEALEAAVTDDARQALYEKIQALQVPFDIKVGNCCAYYKNLEAEEEMIKAEEFRLKARRNAIELRRLNFLAYMEKFVPQTNWEGGIHQLKWSNTPGAAEILDESQIPLAFKKEIWEVTIDKETILRLLRAGEDVPGTRLNKRRVLKVK